MRTKKSKNKKSPLKDTEKFKKLKLIRIVTTELIIMTVSVCVCIMPQPYNIIVPIIIGARSILLKAKLYSKSSSAKDFERDVRR